MSQPTEDAGPVTKALAFLLLGCIGLQFCQMAFPEIFGVLNKSLWIWIGEWFLMMLLASLLVWMKGEEDKGMVYRFPKLDLQKRWVRFQVWLLIQHWKAEGTIPFGTKPTFTFWRIFMKSMGYPKRRGTKWAGGKLTT